ncbi:MAG: PKD domain-containing protein [Patescibacteria group bacterium]
MRIVSLFALVILFPAFAHAADPPTLTTYTVSHGTIYPGATAESGLATTTTIDIAFSEQVRASIKILSSSGIKVKQLYPSSGSSSDPVTNPTPKIWNGTNTAGATVSNGTYTIFISATSTASNLTMSDSSKTVIVASSDSTPPADEPISESTTTTAPASGGGPTEYLPIPMLRIITGGNRTVSSGADTAFTAVVYDGKSNKRDDAVVTWSFGDGMRRTGASVFHTYYEPGEYLAVVHATTSDGGDARSEIIVTIKDASIKIASVSSRGITLANNDSRTLDLSAWRLSMSGQEFKIPADTQILAGRTVIFSSRVIQLPIADSAFLLYPSGEVAATYPAVAAIQNQLASGRQPSSDAVSYKKVSEVEPILSASTNIQIHDDAVGAPAATTELAAAGAALLTVPPTSPSRAAGIFKSPWTLGFLGVLALAGAAFIFL